LLIKPTGFIMRFRPRPLLFALGAGGVGFVLNQLEMPVFGGTALLARFLAWNSVIPFPWNRAILLQYPLNGFRLAPEAALKRSIQPSASCARSGGTLIADSCRLKQTFAHLLSNTVKFTTMGGTASLSATQSGPSDRLRDLAGQSVELLLSKPNPDAPIPLPQHP
jgi:hypothetical protein